MIDRVKNGVKIISRNLFIFYPIFSAVYNQEWLILQTIYVLNNEILQKNPRCIIKSGFKSRAGYNGASRILYSKYTPSLHHLDQTGDLTSKTMALLSYNKSGWDMMAQFQLKQILRLDKNYLHNTSTHYYLV